MGETASPLFSGEGSGVRLREGDLVILLGVAGLLLTCKVVWRMMVLN